MPYSNKPAYFTVWCWLLSEAQWQEGKQVYYEGRPYSLKPGQFTCGAYQISDQTGVPRGSVERILKRFESEERLRKETDRQKTIITILNWGDYQDDSDKMGNDWGTTGERLRTTEERKKERSKEIEYTPPKIDWHISAFDQLWKTYNKKVGRQQALKAFQKITQDEFDQIMAHVPEYVRLTPDKSYRKHLATYLNGRGWEDELIQKAPEQRRMHSEYQPMTSAGSAIKSFRDV